MHGMLGVPAKPAWFPDWSGEICAIVASGPSITPDMVSSLRGRCCVAVVNNNYQLAPWADLLYAADLRWWDVHKGVKEFGGLKVMPTVHNLASPDGRAAANAASKYGLNLVTVLGETDTDVDRIVVDVPGVIARGGNSAFQAVNLVTQFGCRRQIWVGFDFTGDHWHGEHPPPLKNPRQRTLDKWCRRFDDQAKTLRRLGVEVVNLSPASMLTAYPKLTFEQAMARWSMPS